MNIKEEEENIVWINLKQITNHIKVIAYNLNDSKTNSIYIEDSNGKYGYNSQITADDTITYFPFIQTHWIRIHPLLPILR